MRRVEGYELERFVREGQCTEVHEAVRRDLDGSLTRGLRTVLDDRRFPALVAKDGARVCLVEPPHPRPATGVEYELKLLQAGHSFPHENPTQEDTWYASLQQVIPESLEYRDGELYWRESRGRVVAGQRAGSPHKGYVVVRIDRVNYLAHRLVWMLHTGDNPPELDHINRIKTDNRIENLRAVTHAENMLNLGQAPGRVSGSVYWNKKRQRWYAFMIKAKKQFHLGSFMTRDEALQQKQVAVSAALTAMQRTPQIQSIN